MSTDVKLLKKPKASLPCISLIGMAGSGKTTIGVALARALGWAFIDTDSLIEAAYATRLQDISDALSRDAFLDMEADFICSLRTSRTVISTGGSVVYRDRGMKRLRDLGLIVRLGCPVPGHRGKSLTQSPARTCHRQRADTGIPLRGTQQALREVR